MGEQGERGEHGVVQQSRALAALRLELARLPLGAVRAADAGDALGDLRHAGADPDRDERGEHPAEHEDAGGAQRCLQVAGRAAAAWRRPTQERR